VLQHRCPSLQNWPFQCRFNALNTLSSVLAHLRLHVRCCITLLPAVLQFKAGSQEVFLFDCGSTHGTFLNRNRLKARVHAPIRCARFDVAHKSSLVLVVLLVVCDISCCLCSWAGPQQLIPHRAVARLTATRCCRFGEDNSCWQSRKL
jgi:hypothetical protein